MLPLPPTDFWQLLRLVWLLAGLPIGLLLGLLVRLEVVLEVTAVLLLVVAVVPVETLESATEDTEGNADKPSGGVLERCDANGPDAAASCPARAVVMAWWLAAGEASGGERKPVRSEPQRHKRSSQERKAGLVRHKTAVAAMVKSATAIVASASAPWS